MKVIFTRWKSYLGVCLIFTLGCGTGVLVDRALVALRMERMINHGPEIITQMVQNRLTDDLSLDATQQEKLKGILSDASQQIQTTRKQIQPQIRGIILDAQHKTEAVLRPDQLDRFHQEIESAKKRFARLPFLSDEETNSANPTPANAISPKSGSP